MNGFDVVGYQFSLNMSAGLLFPLGSLEHP